MKLAKILSNFTIAAIFTASITGICAQEKPATASGRIYAQMLVDGALARHPEIATLAMHVTAPNAADNVIIASNFGSIGKKADADDLGVIKTGKAKAEVGKNGDRYSVELPLEDASGNTVGALAIAFPYKKGDDQAKFMKMAEQVRNELRRQISNVGNLVEPAQFDAEIPLNTYAQKLLDDAMARHPEVSIMAMHVTPPNKPDNVIIASSIGRIGKKADEDDMNVVNTGKPNLEVNKNGDRFEVEMVLLDTAGENIGALSVVYPYKNGDDKAKLEKMAEGIREELRRKISHAGNLLDPYPYSAPPVSINTYSQKLVDEEMAKHPELLILMMHVTMPDSNKNVIVGSSIGRVGKEADEDDMRVVNTGKPNLEVNSTGKRFEVELTLQDKPGKTIGALGVVFPYKDGDDKAALQKKAEQIRDDLRMKIPSAASLVKSAQ